MTDLSIYPCYGFNHYKTKNSLRAVHTMCKKTGEGATINNCVTTWQNCKERSNFGSQPWWPIGLSHQQQFSNTVEGWGPRFDSPLGITISITQKYKYFVAIQIAGGRVTCVAYDIEKVINSGYSHMSEPAQEPAQELHSRAAPSVKGNITAQSVQPQGEISEEGTKE